MTQQGIPVKVRGVVIYKVGDDFVSIANAARRFLEQQKSMDGAIHELFTGHLRSIIGNLTVEDLILNRERLTSETRGSAADEMSKLGLIVDSLQIQEIHDDAGYITNLGRPHAAKVAAAARIAEAERNQEATQREQEALRENAAVIRDTEIKKAEYEGQVQQAAQQARQEVILKETRNAELEAERTEKRLESEVRKPADARAYEQVKLAEAEREERISYAQAAATEVQLKAQRESEAIRLLGEAEADATRQKGLAEAEAIKARAVALAENTDAVIAQQLAEKWPEIVEAGRGRVRQRRQHGPAQRRSGHGGHARQGAHARRHRPRRRPAAPRRHERAERRERPQRRPGRHGPRGGPRGDAEGGLTAEGPARSRAGPSWR
ncbi:SPFH domain-containing protein [Actinomadura madurae]|uniref:SPFH domain-containing protein n=1 Tax=Actinomadura madurae TaxID=1993 RepID=UPI0020D23829|nr:flotillin family protein [Actinomadura madurae]MCP9980863.1 SPFH domain-containing protein [Actinomadura madurae]